MGPMEQNQSDEVTFDRVRQVAAPVGSRVHGAEVCYPRLSCVTKKLAVSCITGPPILAHYNNNNNNNNNPICKAPECQKTSVAHSVWASIVLIFGVCRRLSSSVTLLEL